MLSALVANFFVLFLFLVVYSPPIRTKAYEGLGKDTALKEFPK